MKAMMKFCLCLHTLSELSNLFSLVPIGAMFSELLQTVIYVFNVKKM